MDIAASLQTSLESLVTKYQDACANPKPNYTLDGKTVAWADYLTMLAEQIQASAALLSSFQPVEIRSVAI